MPQIFNLNQLLQLRLELRWPLNRWTRFATWWMRQRLSTIAHESVIDAATAWPVSILPAPDSNVCMTTVRSCNSRSQLRCVESSEDRNASKATFCCASIAAGGFRKGESSGTKSIESPRRRVIVHGRSWPTRRTPMGPETVRVGRASTDQARPQWSQRAANACVKMEVPPGFEPGMEVLQLEGPDGLIKPALDDS